MLIILDFPMRMWYFNLAQEILCKMEERNKK